MADLKGFWMEIAECFLKSILQINALEIICYSMDPDYLVFDEVTHRLTLVIDETSA